MKQGRESVNVITTWVLGTGTLSRCLICQFHIGSKEHLWRCDQNRMALCGDCFEDFRQVKE